MSGRNRYFRRASSKVVALLEGIMAIALDGRPRFRPLSHLAEALRLARVCYDHFAGRLGVGLADFLDRRGYVAFEDEGGRITATGSRFLAEFGVDLRLASQQRRQLCRCCVDWTERRPHIGGALGAALARRCFELGWTERRKHGRAVIITPTGRQGLHDRFELVLGDADGKIAA